nr:metallophosphoesterase [Leptolyngbyaceae cyanobacterium MO_188.B28]
ILSDKIQTPISIAIIADIQTDSPGRFEENALRRVMNEKPDLILFPGDYIQQYELNSYQTAQNELNSIFKKVGLNAPLGVYTVQGNVDKDDIWKNLFVGLPVTPIEPSFSFDLGPVFLTGLSLYDSFDGSLSLEKHSKFHIVFGHAPDYSLGDIPADLLFAGHTHGGQVQLPWIGPLITLSSVPRSWAEGLTKLDSERRLIVSRGVGMERGSAPRLRFLCPPEIVIVKVDPII